MRGGQSYATRWLPGVLVVCLAAAITFRAFGDVPVYLGGDEAHFGIQAYAIATTGRDLNGHVMPLFFNVTDPLIHNNSSERWYQPILFYLTALVLTFRPLSESSIRLAPALIGVLDVLLIYAVAMRLFANAWYPTLAALMLALTPAHLIFSRQGLDYIGYLPFVLGWLWCLIASIQASQTGHRSLAFAAGLLLGLGCYSYIAAWVLMPFYLLLTWLAQYKGGQSLRLSALAALGFVLPLLPLPAWLWSHPAMAGQTAGRYELYDTRHLSFLQGVKDFFNYNNIQERISVYWDYFNPAFLFFSGGSNPTTATSHVGVFLVPVSVFLLFGTYDLWKRGRWPMGLVLLAGFASAPIPATLVDERYAIQRELVVVPFVVLISTFGIAFLWRLPNTMVRVATVLLLAIAPIQYAHFYRDYFSDYQVRSAIRFDPINFRGVAEYLIANDGRGDVPAVYLSENLDDVGARWKFYSLTERRQDLWDRTRYFAPDGFDVSRIPDGSLLVLYANDPKVPDLIGPGKCSVVKTVVDVAGSKSAVILRKG